MKLTDRTDPADRIEPTDRIDLEFHRRYYASHVWAGKTLWRGIPCQKCPLDLWVYQEILTLVRPGYVIETGSAAGGSALFLADVCEALGEGHVVSVDIQGAIGSSSARPYHRRITWLIGDSISLQVVASIAEIVSERPGAARLVILDSDHRQPHVAAELERYHRLVTPGSYLIVEDTNINGHPISPGWGPGPYEAVEEFLTVHPEFERDLQWEKFGLTFNPGGFLRRREQ